MSFSQTIPKHFEIIQDRQDVLEFKSVHHYWKLMQGRDILILAHKHHLKDKYHKQFVCHSPVKAFRYIVKHDTYVSSKLSSQCSPPKTSQIS